MLLMFQSVLCDHKKILSIAAQLRFPISSATRRKAGPPPSLIALSRCVRMSPLWQSNSTHTRSARLRSRALKNLSSQILHRKRCSQIGMPAFLWIILTGSRRKPWIRHGSIILMSVHSWLVQDSGRKILVDPGVGNGKNRPYAPYFDRLNNPFLERFRRSASGPRTSTTSYSPFSTSITSAGTRAWKGDAGYLPFPTPDIYIFPYRVCVL